MRIQQLRFLFLATAIGVLAGCGGGSDDDNGAAPVAAPAPAPAPGAAPAPAPGVAAAIDKYVGNWTMCMAENGGSTRENLTVTKTSDSTANFAVVATRHVGATCAGNGTSFENASGTMTLVGTKSIAGETVDKVNVVEGTVSSKQVFLVRNNGTFFTGIPTDEAGSSPDTEGYPSALDPTPFTKL